MASTNNANFSLLSQNEIDVLVKFLLEKKETLGTDVMNQKSIDKLIMLIQTDYEKLSTYLDSSYARFDKNILKDLHFRENDADVCTLHFNTDETTHFVTLEITNETTKQAMPLLPKHFDDNDSDAWGISMPPVLFTHLAHTLSIKFTQETYDKVCDTFTSHQYGTLNYPLPAIYLPDNMLLLECIQ